MPACTWIHVIILIIVYTVLPSRFIAHMSDIGHRHPLHGSNRLCRCHRYSFAKTFLCLCRQCRQWGSAHCLDHTEHLKTQWCLIRMQWSKWCIWIQTWLHDINCVYYYTRGGEVELPAEHSSISGVPAIVTHCPPASINTYLHSPLKVVASTADKPHHPTETHDYIYSIVLLWYSDKDFGCVHAVHRWQNSPTVTDQNVLSLITVEFNPQYVASTATPNI